MKAKRMENVFRQFDIGDRVQVTGEAREPAHAGTTASVSLVNGNAYGLCFDGTTEVYRWYVDNELELVEEENEQDLPGMMNRASRVKLARPLAKLKQGKTDWYKIKNLANGTAEVSIYDEIGYWGVTASDFCAELKGISASQIDVRLNSPGGEVFDGIAIYNALIEHSATVNVYIDGLAASAASFIAQAGDTRTMAATATMMIHDGFGMVVGNAADMRETADLLDKTSDNIASIYAARAGGDVETWRAAMQKETWYSADEAKSAGLVDAVTPRKGEESAEPSNAWDLSIFNGPAHAAAEDPAEDAPEAPEQSTTTNDDTTEACWDPSTFQAMREALSA